MATAHFERGRYDEAERIVADWQLTKSLEGIILLAKCDWERGFPDRALQRLEAEIARFPKRDELYLHIVRYHRELGHAAEARRYALLRQFNDPASPGPRVDLIYTYHGTGDKAAEARELAAYFHDFTVDPNALVLLTWFAVETVQPDLADRVAIVAKERNYPLDAFAIGRVQAQLAAQHYQAALDLALTGMREDNAENAAFNTTLNGLRCVALFGLKDNTRAEAMLRSFVGQAKLRPAEALLLARQLRLIGTLAAARLVLARATVVDPLNQAALAELVRIDAETGNREKLTENIPRLLRMRKPSRAVLEETLLRLNQPADAALRDQIREAISRSSATPVP
jgi:predicted Zn-dependent protease